MQAVASDTDRDLVIDQADITAEMGAVRHREARLAGQADTAVAVELECPRVGTRDLEDDVLEPEHAGVAELVQHLVGFRLAHGTHGDRRIGDRQVVEQRRLGCELGVVAAAAIDGAFSPVEGQGRSDLDRQRRIVGEPEQCADIGSSDALGRDLALVAERARDR